ncbi:MAG: hypothetical protein Q9M36_08130 [Sulfurovum sp.]|nr:hypothetical protein [Sulfurovum sp.]
MMAIIKNIKQVYFSVGVLCLLVFTPNLLADKDIAFHDVASTVIMNSLQPVEDRSFLKQLYRQLFFMPVWVKEEGLSDFSKDLFAHIENDQTLSTSSKLKQDVPKLRYYASEVFSNQDLLVNKIKLEFEIAQLYKGYADYKLYGSINWGAFQGRIYNLKAKSINAEWVTYKPKYSPISLMEHVGHGTYTHRYV